MLDKSFQNGIMSRIEKINPEKSFMGLLKCEEPGKYGLRVNLKYSSIMPHAFWCAVSRSYWPLCFVDLPEDIYYQLEERRSGDGTNK